jgi:hypothetical protein
MPLIDLCDKSCFARSFAWLGKRNAKIAPVQPKVRGFAGTLGLAVAERTELRCVSHLQPKLQLQHCSSRAAAADAAEAAADMLLVVDVGEFWWCSIRLVLWFTVSLVCLR